jgi:hypothetical protein
MPAPTVAVTVDLSAMGGEAIEGVTVRARLDMNEVYEEIIISRPVEEVTDANGIAILNLFPNAPSPTGLGTQGSTYRFTASIPNGRSLNVRARVPNEACRLENILVDSEPVTLSAAELALAQAQTAVTTAATSAAAAAASATTAAGSESTVTAASAAAVAAAAAAAASEVAALAGAASAQFADYTALRAYAGESKNAVLTGYLVSAAPSGIAGTFTRDDDDTTSADNGGTIIVASNGKRWKRVYDGAINVRWFGAKGDGATDDTDAIQAAIDVTEERDVLVPEGIYLIDGVLEGRANLTLRGVNAGKSILKKKAASIGHILDILGTSDKENIEIADLTFDVNLIDSGIVAEYVTNFAVRRCIFKDVPFWGVLVGVQNGADTVIRNTRVVIEDCTFDNCTQTYEQLLLLNSQQVDVRRCKFTTGTLAIGIGIYQNVDTVRISDCDFSGLKNGSYYSLSCNNITYSKCDFDGNTLGITGANLSDNGAFGATHVKNLKVLDCHFTGNADSGLTIGAVKGYKVRGCTFTENHESGVIVNAGGIAVSAQPSFGLFDGCSFTDNNADNISSVNAPGIAFVGIGGAQSTRIVGCQFLDTRGTPQQLYPITFVGAFTWSDIGIADCDLNAYSGATSVGLVDGTLSNVSVRNCSGVGAGMPAGIVGITYTASAAFNPPSLADGAGHTEVVTVTGCQLGDIASASFSNSTSEMSMTADVVNTNTVVVRLQNESGGTLDLASGTLRVVTERI